jgi:hypothetical protein
MHTVGGQVLGDGRMRVLRHRISLGISLALLVLDFLDTWVAGGLGLGGLGLGLPQAPQSPCESVSVGHVRTLISISACSVCSSFLLHVNQHLLFPTAWQSRTRT